MNYIFRILLLFVAFAEFACTYQCFFSYHIKNFTHCFEVTHNLQLLLFHKNMVVAWYEKPELTDPVDDQLLSEAR